MCHKTRVLHAALWSCGVMVVVGKERKGLETNAALVVCYCYCVRSNVEEKCHVTEYQASIFRRAASLASSLARVSCISASLLPS